MFNRREELGCAQENRKSQKINTNSCSKRFANLFLNINTLKIGGIIKSKALLRQQANGKHGKIVLKA
jgi:hypothetical protein